MFKTDSNFQTPPNVAAYMAKLADDRLRFVQMSSIPHILEPTPGAGNLVGALNDRYFCVYAPEYDQDFWESWVNTSNRRYDAVVMNPPFSPIPEMERFVWRAMELSNIVVALLPWNFLINSERRLKHLEHFGLVHIINLPRKTFPKCRIQTMIVVLEKGYNNKVRNTRFSHFTW